MNGNRTHTVQFQFICLGEKNINMHLCLKFKVSSLKIINEN